MYCETDNAVRKLSARSPTKYKSTAASNHLWCSHGRVNDREHPQCLETPHEQLRLLTKPPHATSVYGVLAHHFAENNSNSMLNPIRSGTVYATYISANTYHGTMSLSCHASELRLSISRRTPYDVLRRTWYHGTAALPREYCVHEMAQVAHLDRIPCHTKLGIRETYAP